MTKAYVLGGAQTDFERNWTREGKNVVALLREVSADTLAAVAIDPDEVMKLNEAGRVACFVGNFNAESYIHQGHLGALLTMADPLWYGVPSARYEAACASGSVAIDAALSKIRAGDYDLCFVFGFELMKTVNSRIGGDYLGYAAWYETEGKGIELPFPKLFGRLADVLLEKYGYDEAQFMHALAHIATKNYDNAKRNPKAQTRGWFMSMDQALDRGSETNPLVGGRLASSDCSQVTDGAVGVVLASERYLQERGLEGVPVVKGWGHRVAPMLFSEKVHDAAGSPYALPWTRRACQEAYMRAGLTASDVDVFETHDCFTSSEFAALSCFGLAEPGDEIAAIEDGAFDYGGTRPVNPSGGLIGCGHPVGATGVRMMLDLWRQVTGKAGAYQVPGATNGMMLNLGGSATTNYSFVIGME